MIRRGSTARHEKLCRINILNYVGASFAILLATTSSTAVAQTASAEQVAELRRQLDELRNEQARNAQRIGEIEGALDRLVGAPPRTAASGTSTAPATLVKAPTIAAAPPASPVASRLQLAGDLRVRYETNRGDDDARNRDRGVIRARLRGTYALSDRVQIGAQLSTGDPDDPNTADVTLSNWDDDLLVSLDQLYAKLSFGNLTLTAGKIPLPFRRTDLVWDGDVSPQGLSASYRAPISGGSSLKATGLFFQIDEASRGPDSSMVGGQIEFSTAPGPVALAIAAGYYDYRLRAIAGADAGDFRSNLLLPSGFYRSDYNLLDLVGTATFTGLGERWPVQLTGNYVHNYGAAVDGDTGYGLDLFVGRTSKQHDWRLGYGFARSEVDSVLAAFSHDNLDIGTNYLLHSLSIDYVPRTNTLLNLTWYHYRPLDPLYAGANNPRDWLDRIRMNFTVNF